MATIQNVLFREKFLRLTMGFGYVMYSHSLVPVIDLWFSGRDTICSYSTERRVGDRCILSILSSVGGRQRVASRSCFVRCDRLRCDLRDGLVGSTLCFIRLSRESGDFQNP